MGETLRYQKLSPVEVVVVEEEDMEEEGVATEADAVEAATEVEDIVVEVCIALLGVFQGSQKVLATGNVGSCLHSFVSYNSLVQRKE